MDIKLKSDASCGQCPFMSDDDPVGGYLSCRVPGGSRMFGRVVKYGELATGPVPEWCPLKTGPITVSIEPEEKSNTLYFRG